MRFFYPLCCTLLVTTIAGGCASHLIQPGETTGARANVVSIAGAQVGEPYKYGGADKYGFDADGLVYYSYLQANFAIPRDAEGQLRTGQPVVFFEARPADLLFYRIKPKQAGSEDGLHVGVYVGDGQMVHAPLGRDEVVLETINNPYWMQRLVGAVKILP